MRYGLGQVLSVDRAVLGSHVGEVLHLLENQLDGFGLLIRGVVVAGQEALDGGAQPGADRLAGDPVLLEPGSTPALSAPDTPAQAPQGPSPGLGAAATPNASRALPHRGEGPAQALSALLDVVLHEF